MNAQRIGPSLAALGLTTALVVVTHFALLLGATEALQVSLRTPPASTLPFQTRTIVMPSQVTAPAAPAPVKSTVRTAASPKAATPTAASPTADEALRAPELEKTEPAPPIRIPAEPATPPSAEVLAQTADKTSLPSPQAPPIPPTPPNEPLQPATPAPRVLAVGALPPSTLISYKLTGQERGLTYYANGELRWQHNPAQYEASLAIKAFLIGSRVFSSVGTVGPQGLMPLRHGDKWRGEKATHFDAKNKQINFSNNKPSADLQPGAQDQVSLYVQLAAAMAGDTEGFKPGSSVSIQTATINDAVPWTLTLQSEEIVQVDGKPVLTTKWVCLPRGKFDTQVELWLSRAHAWLPVRIRITQVSGSFIDMAMDNIQPLAPLVSSAAVN
jgi:hypothetical protein